MSMSEYIASKFAENGWTWSLKGRGHVVPDEDDVEAALDNAARVMYDMDPDENPQIHVGRLIIKKHNNTHEVYLYVGDFE